MKKLLAILLCLTLMVVCIPSVFAEGNTYDPVGPLQEQIDASDGDLTIDCYVHLTSDLILDNRGIRLVEGGELVVPSGTKLVNWGWIDLAGGKLVMNGTYEGSGALTFFPADYSSGSLDDAVAELPVSMIACEKTVTDAAELETVMDETNTEGFQQIRAAISTPIELMFDLTIPSGKGISIFDGGNLTVPAGKALTIDQDATLTMHGGSITLDGTLENNGQVNMWSGDASIAGSGMFVNNGGFEGDPKGLSVAVEGVEIYRPVYTEAELRQKLAEKGWADVGGEITLDEDLTLDGCGVNLVYGGSLIVPAGKTLTNYGDIGLWGGYLDVENGTYEDQGADCCGSVIFHPEEYAADLQQATNLPAGKVSYEVAPKDFDSVLTELTKNPGISYRQIRVDFEGSETLTTDLTIPAGKVLIIRGDNSILTVPNGKTLTISSDAELVIGNRVELHVDGTVVNNGHLTMWDDSFICGNGEIQNSGWINRGRNCSITVSVTVSDSTLRQQLQESDWVDISENITLADNLEIPEGKDINLLEGASLTVPSSYTLTNYGGIHLDGGELTVEGRYIRQGDGYVVLVANRYADDYVPTGLRSDDLNGWVALTDASELEGWMNKLSHRFSCNDVNLIGGSGPQELKANLTIPEGVNFGLDTKLTVPASFDICVQGGLNIRNDGEIELNGTINNYGWLCVDGTITGSGKIVSTGIIEHVENIAQSVTVTEGQPEDPNAINTEEKLREKLASGETTVEISGSFSLTKDLEIPENKSVTLSEGAVLTVPEGCTLTSNGCFDIWGELVVNGKFLIYNYSNLHDTITGNGLIVEVDGVLNYDVETNGNTDLTVHAIDSWVAPKEPTCGEDGNRGYYTCLICEEFHNENYDLIAKSDVVVEATKDHKLTEYTVIEQPTCNSTGLRASNCDVCGTRIEEIIAATDDHIEGEITVTNAPTCTQPGEGTYTCSRCEAIVTVEIEATGHTEVVEEAAAPTCTEPGRTEGRRCSVCKAVTLESEQIEALGHDIVIDVEEVKATCTEDGKTGGSHCTRCDLKEESTTITKLGHTEVEVNEVAATCTEDGTTAGHKCSVCGDVLDGCAPIEKLGHDEVPDEDEAPTATTHGKQGGSHCQRCDEVIKAPVPVTEHAEKQTVTKATLTANGRITYTCSVCGEKIKDDTVIPMVNSVTIASSSYTYNGKVISPAVTVKDAGGKTLVKDTDYTVSYSSGCKDVGTYKVTIKGKGNYSFTKELSFKINPVKTAIAKVTAGEKAFTVKWSKKTKQVTGYEIQYSLKKNFASGNKTVTIKGNTTVSKTIKKLKGGKTYYVRVRTYKTVGKTKFYSAWSAVKSVKTKK